MKGLRRRSLWVLASITAAAGCGGGQSGSGASATIHTSKSGYAVLTYFGQPQPQLGATSGLISSVGQAGATFSTITLEPPPNLNDTYLVLGRAVDGEIVLYKVPYATGVPQLLYQNNDGANFPAISAYGTIAFDTNALSIETVRADGTDPVPLTLTSVDDPAFPAYATDGTNRLVFCPHVGETEVNLDVAPGTGGAASAIQVNDYSLPHAWNPSGTEIAYSVADATAGNADLYKTPSTGGTAVDITPTSLRNTGVVGSPTWNADGQTIVAGYVPTGSNEVLIKFNVSNPTTYTALTPSGGFQQEPTFSPDGSKLAYYDESSGSTAGIYGAASALLIAFMHRANIARLLAGTESVLPLFRPVKGRPPG